MAPSFWSTSLFEEAARLVAEFAFAIDVKRIEARAVVKNSRANRALEKIGAKGRRCFANPSSRTRRKFSGRLCRMNGPRQKRGRLHRSKLRKCARRSPSRRGDADRAAHSQTSVGAAALPVLPDREARSSAGRHSAGCNCNQLQQARDTIAAPEGRTMV